MLRRRRGQGEEPEEAEETGLAGAAGDEAGADLVVGPWDVNDDVPPAERIDFGSMRVPVAEGLRGPGQHGRGPARVDHRRAR